MKTKLTREEAIHLLMDHNKEAFHVRHGLTVGGVMRWYANELGYAEDADFWEIVGILHDVDFEEYPDQHCYVAPEILKAAGAEEELIHGVVCHCYGHNGIDVEPVHMMEKVLYAADELTGLIWAAAKMRPSRSTSDMEVSSLKKKFKDKRFAAGCSRDVIREGAERLEWELPKLFELTINAMRTIEKPVDEEMIRLGFQEE